MSKENDNENMAHPCPLETKIGKSINMHRSGQATQTLEEQCWCTQLEEEEELGSLEHQVWFQEENHL